VGTNDLEGVEEIEIRDKMQTNIEKYKSWKLEIGSMWNNSN